MFAFLKELTDKRKMKPLPPPKPGHLTGVEKTEPAAPTKEEQCSKLSLELQHFQKELELRHEELGLIVEEISQIRQNVEHKAIQNENNRKELERKEKLYSLLPDAPMHLKRIQDLLESNKKKMAILKKEWVEIKQPLEDEYQRALQERNNVNDFCLLIASWQHRTYFDFPRMVLSSWRPRLNRRLSVCAKSSKKSIPKKSW